MRMKKLKIRTQVQINDARSSEYIKMHRNQKVDHKKEQEFVIQSENIKIEAEVSVHNFTNYQVG